MKEIRYTKNDLLEIEKEVNNLIELIENNKSYLGLYDYKVHDFFSEVYKYISENNLKIENLEDIIQDYLDMSWYLYSEDCKNLNLLNNCEENPIGWTSKRYLTNDIINDRIDKDWNIESDYNEFTQLLYFLDIKDFKEMKYFFTRLKNCDKKELVDFIYTYICYIDSLKESIEYFKEQIQDIINARKNIENYKNNCNLEDFLLYSELNEMEF